MCETYRFGGHHVSDSQAYKDANERREWETRDPIVQFGIRLQQKYGVAADALAKIDGSINASVKAASERALSDVPPETRDLYVDLYAH